MQANRSPQRIILTALLLLAWQGTLHAGEFPVADKIVIEKAERKLHLVKDGESFRTFEIALGIRPSGDKEYEGDFKTPEGVYSLDARNPHSEFFLSIHVSYPDIEDVRQARSKGLQPGGAIMIHGQPNEPTRSEAYYRTQDWTNGCIAVSNSDMIDIWLMTPDNTPIEIKP
ncbi:MAG: L,D-transpeptidase family protein [Desulfobulbaceae bacterium]|nr:L,D-transpeptidase family protein [Desulfobulbaceae bacterium]